jgi:hypothetical protein
VTAGFGLAVVGTLLRKRAALVVAGWAVAVAGFAAALAVSRSVVTSVDGLTTRAWPGAELAVAAVGLLIAAAPAAEWLASGLAGAKARRAKADGATGEDAGGAVASRGGRDGAPARMLAVIALAAVASAPILAAWFWVAGGVRGPVAAVAMPVLPPFVAASDTGGFGYRTLVLRDDDGTLSYAVLRQGDPSLGEPELTGYAPADQALARQVAALGAPVGADAGDPGLALGEFGIRWVLMPSPVNMALAQRLDASVGLVQHSSAPAYALWQVTGPVSRVRAIATDGSVTALPAPAGGTSSIPASTAGGTLVLAEPYGGWTATVNGRALMPLPRAVDGWAQGFTLPASGGQLVIRRDNTARDISLIAEVLAVLAVAVLALPGSRAAQATAGAESPAASREPEPGRNADRGTGRTARDGARNQAGRTGSALEGPRRRAHDAAPLVGTAAGGVGLLTGSDEPTTQARPATSAGRCPDPAIPRQVTIPTPGGPHGARPRRTPAGTPAPALTGVPGREQDRKQGREQDRKQDGAACRKPASRPAVRRPGSHGRR